MGEFSNGATRVPAPPSPPSPPRWKGIQSLDLVYQLNERCLETLCEVAAPDARPTNLPIVTENRELWVHLEPGARQKAARVPFVIVDAHFKEQAWWRKITADGPHEAESEEPTSGLPREASEHLMHETTIFAWQTARWDKTVAQMSLGMSLSVADVIAALTPQQIRAIAARERQGVQVRWADDPRFWRDLLSAAKAGDDQKLAELHLHAKLLMTSELAQLRK